MQPKIPGIRAIAAAFALALTAATGHALVLDWANLPGGQSWADGATTGEFDLDGDSSNDILIEISNLANVTWLTNPANGNPYPQVTSSAAIASGATSLQLWASTPVDPTAGGVQITITFIGNYAGGAFGKKCFFSHYSFSWRNIGKK